MPNHPSIRQHLMLDWAHDEVRQVDWMQAWLDQMNLKGITLVCQDWGGLIGLRLLAANPDRFDRVEILSDVEAPIMEATRCVLRAMGPA